MYPSITVTARNLNQATARNLKQGCFWLHLARVTPYGYAWVQKSGLVKRLSSSRKRIAQAVKKVDHVNVDHRHALMYRAIAKAKKMMMNAKDNYDKLPAFLNLARLSAKTEDLEFAVNLPARGDSSVHSVGGFPSCSAGQLGAGPRVRRYQHEEGVVQRRLCSSDW
ncbi:unnamed protein product [Phytophthora fragariaefolia]|uniref:Unnamed protein product n=1 Tax=Phytophthora fragariaefolia TaxID=1490495 RepID=A0A9W6Y6C7_9STRA|nr:unnamed protein product [Phytophthora fragariaefolia]